MQCRGRLRTLLLGVVVALAGCGGTRGAVHATPQFVAIADTICANANSEIAALPASGRTLQALAVTAARELPIVRLELTQLSALTAPAPREAQFEAALATTRREDDLVSRLIAAVRAGNITRVTTLALRGRAVAASAQTAMTSLGLSACAREAVPHGH
jgi:hypothetical protein